MKIKYIMRAIEIVALFLAIILLNKYGPLIAFLGCLPLGILWSLIRKYGEKMKELSHH
ncbi:hypothetical protein [Rodentibacter haemolyticus]|uniref:Uncharacterized protein n=1 Tax=Rodentibacter haemolyticus TaxID=2778911 RepID=A0ABX6UUH7_9PAST|nr:hypothetical protein [Rodentibacter haemolyticus]QPB41622.1 hypothetical protein IHV77_06640 [Rodentibacter haemolyticus]